MTDEKKTTKENTNAQVEKSKSDKKETSPKPSAETVTSTPDKTKIKAILIPVFFGAILGAIISFLLSFSLIPRLPIMNELKAGQEKSIKNYDNLSVQMNELKKIIKPKKNLTFAENFFYMCFGKVPQKEIVKAFDVSLILYAEHSFNVSTFTARTITSSLSDIHGAITGAIASLKGPLHGGANEEVMHMMNKIKKPENALKWINNALKNKEVVMGFGHRVYKSGDSRVPTMKEYFKKVAKIKKDTKFLKIYEIAHLISI